MKLVKLKPATPGLLVRMPPTPGSEAYLPEEGQTVEMNTYWYRHMQDGAVVEVTDETPVVAESGVALAPVVEAADANLAAAEAPAQKKGK